MLKNNRYQMKYAEKIMKATHAFSASTLQRRLGIGYLRASRIAEEMKVLGCQKKRTFIPYIKKMRTYYKKKRKPIQKPLLSNTEDLLFYIYAHGNSSTVSIQNTFDIVGSIIDNEEDIILKLKIDDTMSIDKVKYTLVWYENLSKDKEEESPSI